MEIIIDKRIELTAVVQTLCNYWDNLSIQLTNAPLFQCKFKNKTTEYFENHKNHETIKLYDSLCHNTADICAFIQMALCYSNPPEFSRIANFENNFEEITAGSMFPHRHFINGLRQFYFDTQFEQYFNGNQDEYGNILKDYGNKEEIEKYTDSIINYLDRKIENYTVVISPLIMGNFGIRINTNGNKTMNYSVLSPCGYKDNRYIFGSKNWIKEYLWHEISHLTINSLTANHINQFSAEEKAIPEIFVKNFYISAEMIINEYIIRAITVRLFEINKEEKFAEYLICDNIQKGFRDIELIKNYIMKNCEADNKLIKDYRYKKLIEYVMDKI